MEGRGKPTKNYWQNFDIIDYLNTLSSLGITQHIPMLFSILEKYPNNKNEIRKKVWPVYVTLIKRVICGRNPNELEKVITIICKNIAENRFEDAKKTLADQAPKKDEVLICLKELEFKDTKTKHLAKAILKHINNSYTEEGIVTKPDLTLEHIIPKSESLSPDKYLVDTIGNLTLLEGKHNTKEGNKKFEKKLNIYKQSDLVINKQLQQYNKWGREEILQRTKTLSGELIKILKF